MKGTQDLPITNLMLVNKLIEHTDDTDWIDKNGFMLLRSIRIHLCSWF